MTDPFTIDAVAEDEGTHFTVSARGQTRRYRTSLR